MIVCLLIIVDGAKKVFLSGVSENGGGKWFPDRDEEGFDSLRTGIQLWRGGGTRDMMMTMRIEEGLGRIKRRLFGRGLWYSHYPDLVAHDDHAIRQVK